MFADIHAHLHVREFDSDREEVIKRAKETSVSKIISVGFDVEGNFQAFALAKKYPFIWATMGIHPHLADEWNDQVAAKIFETSKKEERIVALGEMGLDYYKNFQPRELQQKVFRAQLKLAKELDLPVIIHCRNAFDDAFKILSEEKMEHVLLHCFTGTLAEAEEGWRRGYGTAFTGIITYPKAENLRKIVTQCPADSLFIESDCPYLAPQKYRGKRNEPAYVPEIYDTAAKIRAVPKNELAAHIFKNILAFFGI